MSHGPSDLESRVSTLERQMRIVTREVAEGRLLACAADEDVSKVDEAVKGNHRVINALRETQLEQGEKLQALDTKVDNLTGVVAEQGLTLAEHGRKLDTVNGRVDALDAKIDSRFDEVLALLRQRPES